MLKKCDHSKDPYIALLNWRNKPQEGVDATPVQRLMGRQTGTLVPTNHRLLQPGDTDQHKIRELENQKMKIIKSQKDLKPLKPLKVNDPVRMQPINAQEEIRKPARVQEQVNPRSYIVETNNGRKCRRDRQFLRLERKPTPTVLSQNATSHISNDNAAEPFSHATRDPSLHAPGVEHNEGVGAADQGR